MNNSNWLVKLSNAAREVALEHVRAKYSDNLEKRVEEMSKLRLMTLVELDEYLLANDLAIPDDILNNHGCP